MTPQNRSCGVLNVTHVPDDLCRMMPPKIGSQRVRRETGRSRHHAIVFSITAPYCSWCEDYYIGCVDNIAKLAFDGYLVREQGLDEDGVEPGEVIELGQYVEGEPQELRVLGTSGASGV